MPRLPIPGQDDGTWGDILNAYLSVSLTGTGALQSSAITQAGGVVVNGSGQVPTGQLGTGTANTTTYLRGDGTWQTPSGSASNATTGAPGLVQLAGDLGGAGTSATAPKVNFGNDTLHLPLTGGTLTGKLTVPSFQVTGGVPINGKVLTSDSSGNAAWAPSTPGVVVSLGSVSGTVSCDLSAGIAFTATLTGDTTFQFTNWPAGLVEPEIYTVQDSTGGHAITISGVTWEPTGSLPTFNTSPNAINIIPVASYNGGTNVYGLTGVQGPTGPTGSTGPTGPAGTSSTESFLGLVTPVLIGPPRVNATSAIGTAFKAVFVRVVMPKSGTLHDVTVYNGSTAAGNHNAAVYDTGDASSGHYTPLWSSGSVAAAGTSNWQVVGDPALTVTAGQQLLLAIMNDGTTNTFGTVGSINSGTVAQLPTNFTPTTGGALPKLLGQATFGSLAYSTITEASLSTFSTLLVIIARVA